MKKKEFMKRIRLLIVLAMIFCFVWFLAIYPFITFMKNEKMVEDAARRYFELNPSELPTGDRLKTLSLNTLYHKSFLKGDVYVPYTHKVCSIDDSWVKVRKVNGEYQYYTYLSCGFLSSRVDHDGPVIKLNGDVDFFVDVGEKFVDPGVQSVVDKVDGKLKVSDVEVKSKVDTSKVGSYVVTYTAYDSLNNKTVATRNVKVVQKLYGTMKKQLGEDTNFKGYADGNYILLSNILFQVFGIDENKNLVVVATEDLANVNYTKIDKWLNYFYELLNEDTKKIIVESKYCNMAVEEENLGTTECTSYTENKKVYVPSIIEINKATSGKANFMKPLTLSWTSNSTPDGKKAYLTREFFYDENMGKRYMPWDVNNNYGVRPMMTIKGDTLIVGGDGTFDNPYVFGDVKVAKAGERLNTRYMGEYVSIDGFMYRIIKTLEDGTTKVVSLMVVGELHDHVEFPASPEEDVIVYNPKERTSNAYYIANRVSSHVNVSDFVTHEIEVPIYKNKIIYGKEIETKKYKVKLSAPNMYEIFSAQPQNGYSSFGYWLVNSSKAKRLTGAITDIGVPINTEIRPYTFLHARIVGFLNKDSTITGGKGTLSNPYTIH